MSRKNPGKRGARDRRRHLGRARESVTRPRPILTHVQDGTDDCELRVFRAFSVIKTPSNRLPAG